MLEEKDAKVEEESSEESFGEAYIAAKKEVDAETVEESSTPEETAPETEEVEKDEETTTLEGLDDDEDFQEAKKEMETEMGGNDLTYSQTKKFRKTYWQAKERERENLKLQEELDTLREKEQTDNEVLGEATKRGLLDKEPRTKEESPEFDLDKLKSNATPEQREWLDIISKISAADKQTLQTKIDKYEAKFGEIDSNRQAKAIENEEIALRTEIKEKYNLDYDKDVLPEIRNLIPEIAKNIPKDMTLLDVGWTPRLLANQVLAGKHMELAKKKLSKETKQLNDKKKLANVETETEQHVAEPVNDIDSSFEEILSDEMSKEGLAKFE